MQLNAQDARRKAFASMLESGDYSDMTIVCSDETFRVHKNIETNSASVELEDDSAIIRIILQYLYEGVYEPSAHAAAARSCGVISFQVEVYAVADRLFIDPLKTLIKDKLQGLQPYNSDFLVAIKRVFEVTRPGDALRQKMVDNAFENANGLFIDRSSAARGIEDQTKDATRLLDEVPELCKELLLKYAAIGARFDYELCSSRRCNPAHTHYHRVERQ